MKNRSLWRWQPVLGIVAAGVAVCGLTLYGAPLRRGARAPMSGASVQKMLEQGYSVPIEVVRWAPPTVGRSSRSLAIEEHRGMTFITGAGSRANTGTVADGGPGGECELDSECDSCSPCADDTCDENGACQTPAEDACESCDDGVYCNGVERCDGQGIGEANCRDAEEVKVMVCKGGPRDEEYCYDFETESDCQECADGSRVGETCCPDNGTCTEGTCDGGDRDLLTCCPGGTCEVGNCEQRILPVDPCAGSVQLCDELEPSGANATGGCVTACDTDDDCQNGSGCDGREVCVKASTVDNPGHGGECTCEVPPCATATGTLCTTEAQCSGDDFCGGVCRDDPAGPVCGQNSYFREPCSNPMVDCGTDRPSNQQPPYQGGRCCVPNGNDVFCCRASRPICLSTGCVPVSGAPVGAGSWLGVGDNSEFPRQDEASCDDENSNHSLGEYFTCPKYAAGITSGNLVDVFGPASVADCRPYWEIGDDYKLQNCDKPDIWYTLRTVRGYFGYDDGTGSRMKITFYDTQGRFIEDVITDPSGTSGIAFRTVPYDEEPVIPCEGIVTLKPWAESNPGSLERWATTDACGPPDVLGAACGAGFNDTGHVYIRETEGGLLLRKHINDVGLTYGVLALEIVGEKRDEPLGACCDTDTGVCTKTLPWVCELADNFFQGVDTACKVCANNPGRACSEHVDCATCETSGDPCPNGDECAQGEDCIQDECRSVPPACETQACCIDDTQKDPIFTCIDRPKCVGGTEDGRNCLSPNDLKNCENGGGDCETECPVGTTSRGVGTDCDPDCCRQLQAGDPYGGADTCAEADIVVINVPPLGSPPVTYTWTGNNKNATFGDYQEDESGTCQFAMFNETGNTRDRGWWHAFSLDDCANVRIDLCCTEVNSGTPHEPQWSGLWTECNPCGETIGSSVVGGRVGLDDTDWNRGMPFCSGGDDLWRTFGPLPKGIYWEPIYSASGGHFGEYQYHVVVEACPEAACCLPTAVCIGGAHATEACPNGNQDCCVDWQPSQNPPCQDPAPGSCVEDCDVLRQSDCDDLNGYWLGLGNIPLTDNPVTSCRTNNAACEVGSCCTGPGECVDVNPEGGGDVDKKDCDVMEGGGTFVGGTECLYTRDPCPACEIVGDTNCQGFDGTNFATLSDLAVKPGGAVYADDFIPATANISRVCVWGIYFDHSVETEPTYLCTGKVEDNFRVRIYNDKNGTPGTLVGERWIPHEAVAKSQSQETYGSVTTPEDYPLTVYTLAFDKITLPAAGAGEIYWLEVANNTTVLTGGVEDRENTCYWHWAHTYFDDGIGNKHSAVGTNDRPCEGEPPVYPNGAPCDPRISGYDNRYSARWSDQVFCLGDSNGPVNFDAPSTPTGAVCSCDPIACTGEETLDNMVDSPSISSSIWEGPNTTCGTCLDPGQIGDNCGTGGAAVGSVAAGVDCTPDALQPGEFIFAEGNHVLVPIDTSCTTTDGPISVLTDTGGDEALGYDVWVCYTATCTGRLTGSMCAGGIYYGGYDAFMAVYHDPAAPEICPCPGRTGAAGQFGRAQDESCNGIHDGGAGMFRGPIVFPGEKWLFRVGGWGSSIDTADRGRGFLDIGCETVDFHQAPAPLPERLALTGGQVAAVDPVNIKNRSISITTAEGGLNQMIRVRFASLPPPYDIWNGQALYVGAPREACENSGKGLDTDPADCPPALPSARYWIAQLECDVNDAHWMDWRGECIGGTCMGGLNDGEVCLIEDDCVEYVHIYHEGIVPSYVPASGDPVPAVYYVDVLDDSNPTQDRNEEFKTCAGGLSNGQTCTDDAECAGDDSKKVPDGKCLDTPIFWSPVLVMQQPRWGDVCGPGPVGACSGTPDGVVDVTNDVLGELDKFANVSLLQKARADLLSGTGEVDFKVDVSTDVLRTLDAFGGVPYPFAPGDKCSAGVSVVHSVPQPGTVHEGSK